MPNTDHEPFYPFKFPRNYADSKGQPKEYITLIKTDESVSPVPIPNWYWDLRQEVAEEMRASGSRLYTNINTEPIETFTRERFGLNSNVGVFVGFEGSNEILERFVLALDDDTVIRTYGPFFTDFLKSIRFARRPDPQIISEPLGMSLEDILIKNTKLRRGKHPDVEVVTEPDIRGDAASLETQKEFAKERAKKGIYTVFDRALGGFIDDSESVARLVNDNPYVIVIESWSKAYGFPDDGFATLIADQRIINKLTEQRRHFHYRHSDYKILYNKMAESGLVLPHLEDSRNIVRAYKPILMQNLEDLGVETLPTDMRTPVVIVDGKQAIFSSELDLLVTTGSGYSETYERNVAINPNPVTDRFARVGLPITDYSDPDRAREEIKIATKRIAGAINVVNQARTPETIIWMPY